MTVYLIFKYGKRFRCAPSFNKQQRRGEYLENIKFSWVSKLNFMFYTFSPLFCCLSPRGPDVRKVRKRYTGSDFSKILEMEQNAPCFSPHILWIWTILPMYHDVLGPRGLQGTHMDTLKPKKKSKSITFTVREGFFTFWTIPVHSVT